MRHSQPLKNHIITEFLQVQIVIAKPHCQEMLGYALQRWKTKNFHLFGCRGIDENRYQNCTHEQSYCLVSAQKLDQCPFQVFYRALHGQHLQVYERHKAHNNGNWQPGRRGPLSWRFVAANFPAEVPRYQSALLQLAFYPIQTPRRHQSNPNH